MTAPRASTVLLVDDVDDNRGMIRQLARRMGLQLLEARNGAEGLHLARTTTPDLILMDLGMPVMDGWTATQHLKADPATAHIPVIAVTAHAGDADAQARALTVGMAAYVTKPIGVVALRTLLEQYLAGGAA